MKLVGFRLGLGKLKNYFTMTSKELHHLHYSLDKFYNNMDSGLNLEQLQSLLNLDKEKTEKVRRRLTGFGFITDEGTNKITESGIRALRVDELITMAEKLHQEEKFISTQKAGIWLTVLFAFFTTLIILWQGCMQQKELEQSQQQSKCAKR